MSDDAAIRARGVGKRYRLGHLQSGYQLLSERLIERARSLGAKGAKPSEPEQFWALRELDFDVKRGETFGIIGHNGAGKSTLLKILSRVTPPTAGRIEIHGRVGALLEVGTGFHPELSGRENVYLNGAILGMQRAEIQRKFDEIVEFAEVEQFIDTPVKRYSSGMYLRLAFSVAAHLEPEILIVDEVLSVGDLAFQEKCLGRMEGVAREGRTVLFVSHNLTAVEHLCPRAMLLERGGKVFEGPSSEVIRVYSESARRNDGIVLADRPDRHGSGRLRFVEMDFQTPEGEETFPRTGEDVAIVLRFETLDGQTVRHPTFAVAIYTTLDQLMLHLSTGFTGTRIDEVSGVGELRCLVPRCPLPPGSYSVSVSASAGGDMLDYVQRACQMNVEEGDYYGTGQRSPESHQAVLTDHSWGLGAPTQPSA